MKRLLPLLLLFLLGACTEKVEVTVISGSWDLAEQRLMADGVDTIWVTCRPFRSISYIEAMVDGVVVGVDTFPGPQSEFEWDVLELQEGSIHRLQARATSGSHEYLSPEVLVKVGYRTRFVVDGRVKTLSVYRPDGVLEASFEPIEGAYPSCPRFRPGCHSIVFIADRKLYSTPPGYNQAADLAVIANGIYSCDASPVSDLVAFEGYPAGTAHLFTVDSLGNEAQITHDSDYVIIDSSRFTCIVNSTPVFSPDGTKLACYRKSKCLVAGDPRENETREDVFVMNSNGSNPVNLTANVGNGYFSGFTWTFDGRWVLFRAGTGATPDAVLAANMSGHAITGLPIAAVAMVCSPADSSLAYVSIDSEHRLYSLRLGWTTDTLYVGGIGVQFGGDAYAQRSYIDWVRYSPQ